MINASMRYFIYFLIVLCIPIDSARILLASLNPEIKLLKLLNIKLLKIYQKTCCILINYML